MVETYLYENVTETFCLGVVAFSSDRYVAVMSCVVSISPDQNVTVTYCLGIFFNTLNYTETVISCLGAIFTCLKYDVAVTCYFSAVLTLKVISTLHIAGT